METTPKTPAAHEIENFAWVEPWLGRGAQPKLRGYTWLEEQGFRVVVNLRIHDETKSVKKFASRLEPIQIAVINNAAPTDEQALQWLEICASRYMRPIFVHCNLGEGRTSAFCALLRLAQRWPLDEAIAEQLAFGFEPDGEHADQGRFLHHFVQKGLAERVWIPDSFKD
jgi:protein tyrosine/serine phosphatase